MDDTTEGADRGSWREERLLKLITDKLPIGLAYVEPDRTYRFANQRFAFAYGLDPEEIVGKKARDFVCDDTMELGDPFFGAAFKGTPVDYVHPIAHADGRNMTVRTYLRPEFSDDRKVLGFFVCSFNVSREKEAEARLMQAQKMEAVGQLASGIAHDFNNLLAVVMGNILPLREKITDPKILSEYIEPTIEAVDRGVYLTRQLLTIARRQPLHPEPLDLNACVTDFLRLLRPIMSKDVSVMTDPAPDLPEVCLDRAQFEVALLNLCLNARDAMPDGGDITISLAHPSPDAGPDYVQLAVADTGVGIPEEVCGQVFEPFFTTKQSGDGTGLGLAMVWGFVNQSEGQIRLESKQGKGTTFFIDLPIERIASCLRKTAPVSHPQTSDVGKLVLLVEDDDAVRRRIGQDLGSSGFTVLEAESAEEALQLIEGVDDLSIMVSDVSMPGMSGYDLAKIVGTMRPDLRIVLMTAGPIDTAEARASGPVPVLQKPFVMQDLIQKITEA